MMDTFVFVLKSLGISGMNRIVLSQISVLRSRYRCVVFYVKDKSPSWRREFEALCHVRRLNKGPRGWMELLDFLVKNRGEIKAVLLHDIPFVFRALPVVAVLGLLKKSFLYYHFIGGLSKGKYLLLERLFSPLVGRLFVSHLCAASCFLRTRVFLPDGCVIINGLSPSLYPRASSSASFPRLVMLSRIKRSKGVDRFLELSKALGEVFFAPFECVLAGVAESEATCKRLSEKLPVETSQGSVWKAVALSIAGFVASESEGMCLVPAELSFYRKPCFLPKASCYSGFYSHKEVLFYHSSEMCLWIASCLMNPRLLLVRALNMRRLFEASYTAEKMVAELLDRIGPGG